VHCPKHGRVGLSAIACASDSDMQSSFLFLTHDTCLDISKSMDDARLCVPVLILVYTIDPFRYPISQTLSLPMKQRTLPNFLFYAASLLTAPNSPTTYTQSYSLKCKHNLPTPLTRAQSQSSTKRSKATIRTVWVRTSMIIAW
jgi:hypothetical protein